MAAVQRMDERVALYRIVEVGPMRGADVWTAWG